MALKKKKKVSQSISSESNQDQNQRRDRTAPIHPGPTPEQKRVGPSLDVRDTRVHPSLGPKRDQTGLN